MFPLLTPSLASYYKNPISLSVTLVKHSNYIKFGIDFLFHLNAIAPKVRQTNERKCDTRFPFIFHQTEKANKRRTGNLQIQKRTSVNQYKLQ